MAPNTRQRTSAVSRINQNSGGGGGGDGSTVASAAVARGRTSKRAAATAVATKAKSTKKNKRQSQQALHPRRKTKPLFLTCPATQEKIWITQATLQDIKEQAQKAKKRQRKQQQEDRLCLVTVLSPTVRADIYQRASQALQNLEESVLPMYGSRPWKVQVRIQDPKPSPTERWSRATQVSPYFCWRQGRLEIAAWPHLIERMPPPPKFPGYTQQQPQPTPKSQPASSNSAGSSGGKSRRGSRTSRDSSDNTATNTAAASSKAAAKTTATTTAKSKATSKATTTTSTTTTADTDPSSLRCSTRKRRAPSRADDDYEEDDNDLVIMVDTPNEHAPQKQPQQQEHQDPISTPQEAQIEKEGIPEDQDSKPQAVDKRRSAAAAKEEQVPEDEEEEEEEEEMTEEELYMLELQDREPSPISEMAYQERWRVPLPTVSLKWISPLHETYHTRKSAWKRAVELCKQEVLLDRVLEGYGAHGKPIQIAMQTLKNIKCAGLLRFQRDGLWVVGQEEQWQRKRLLEQQPGATLVVDNMADDKSKNGNSNNSKKKHAEPTSKQPQESTPQQKQQQQRKKRALTGLALFLQTRRKEYRKQRLEQLQRKSSSSNDTNALNETGGSSSPETMGSMVEEVWVVQDNSKEPSPPQSQTPSFAPTVEATSATEATGKTSDIATKQQGDEAVAAAPPPPSVAAVSSVEKTDVAATSAGTRESPPSIQGDTKYQSAAAAAPHSNSNLSYEVAIVSSDDEVTTTSRSTTTTSAVTILNQSGHVEQPLEHAPKESTHGMGMVSSSDDGPCTPVKAAPAAAAVITPTEECPARKSATSSISFTLRMAETELRTEWKKLTEEERKQWEEEAKRIQGAQEIAATLESQEPGAKKQTSGLGEEPARQNDDTGAETATGEEPADENDGIDAKTETGEVSPTSLPPPEPSPPQQRIIRWKPGPSQKWCLSSDQIKLCHDAGMEHYEQIVRTVKARDLSRELQDGFDLFRERGRGRFDMELPAFDTPEFSFLTDLKKAPWMPVVREILGKDVVLIHRGMFMSLSGAERQVYHQDGTHLTNQYQKKCHAINVFVPLVDLSLENGPTEFCLGSHILGHEDFDEDFLETPLVAAGTPIIFDYRLGHRGLANTSAAPRPIVYCTYASAADGKEFRDSVNFSRKRYHKIGDLVSKVPTRDERAKKRERSIEEQQIQKALDASLAAVPTPPATKQRLTKMS